jgi:hypothetical protein
MVQLILVPTDYSCSLMANLTCFHRPWPQVPSFCFGELLLWPGAPCSTGNHALVISTASTSYFWPAAE